MDAFSKVICGNYDSRSRFKQDGITSQKRIVNCYEIEMYTAVSDGYASVNDIIYPHKHGNLLIARPGDVRYSYLGHYTAYYVHFQCNDSKVSSYYNNFPRIMKAVDMKSLFNLMAAVSYKIKSEETDKYLFITSKLYELTGMINDFSIINSRSKSTYYQHFDSINKTTKYIRENYSKDITLDEAAEVAHLSRSYFHQVFKNLVGMTPCEYLMYRRIKEAQIMLINTKMSICEIAFATGFASQSYFCSSFKHACNITPQNYRKAKSPDYDIPDIEII